MPDIDGRDGGARPRHRRTAIKLALNTLQIVGYGELAYFNGYSFNVSNLHR